MFFNVSVSRQLSMLLLTFPNFPKLSKCLVYVHLSGAFCVFPQTHTADLTVTSQLLSPLGNNKNSSLRADEGRGSQLFLLVISWELRSKSRASAKLSFFDNFSNLTTLGEFFYHWATFHRQLFGGLDKGILLTGQEPWGGWMLSGQPGSSNQGNHTHKHSHTVSCFCRCSGVALYKGYI